MKHLSCAIINFASSFLNSHNNVTFNMAVQLIECNKEQRSVIRFLWAGGVRTGEIYESITV